MSRFLTAMKFAAGSLPVTIKSGPNAGLKWSFTTSGRGYGDGTFESVRMALLCAILKPGECFWDIGAHKGYVSLLASRLVGPRGCIHTFEPAAENLGFLKRHLAWNNAANVTVHPVAVADRDGREKFGGKASIAFRLGQGRETVDVRSIASLLRNDGLPQPTLIKIDAENAEAQVLDGPGDSLFSPDRAILVSNHSFESYSSCFEILSRSGFRVVESGAIRDLRQRDWDWVSDPDILAVGPERDVPESALDAFGMPSDVEPAGLAS